MKSYAQAMKDAQREIITGALLEARGNRSLAAELLQMNRQHFQKLLKHHGLTRSYTSRYANRGNGEWQSLRH